MINSISLYPPMYPEDMSTVLLHLGLYTCMDLEQSSHIAPDTYLLLMFN